MDKLGSKPLHAMSIIELRDELQWTRNELLKARQLNKDLQGAYVASLAVEKEWQERQRPRPTS